MRGSELIEEFEKGESKFRKILGENDAKISDSQRRMLDLNSRLLSELQMMAAVVIDQRSHHGDLVDRLIQKRESATQQKRQNLEIIESEIAKQNDLLLENDRLQHVKKNECHQKLMANESYQLREKKLSAMIAYAKETSGNAKLLASESSEKLEGYKGNKIYNYLRAEEINGRLSTGNKIKRFMDRWLKSLVNYDTNRHNENQLRSIAQAVESIIEKMESDIQVLANEQKSTEDQEMAASGLPELKNAQRIILGTLEKLKGEAKGIQADLDARAWRKDQEYKDIQDLIASKLSSLNLSELEDVALKTSGEQDDQHVRVIRDIKEKIKDEESLLELLLKKRASAESDYDKVKKLKRKVKDQVSTGSRYSYDSNLDVGSLIVGYLAGSINEKTISSTISDAETITRSSYSSGSSSSWSSSSSDSFSSSGGFGGGSGSSFSTSDSF